MTFDEIKNSMTRAFFVIATGAVFATGVFCAIFYPAAVFGVDMFFKILLLALSCDLLFFVFYSKTPLNRRQMIARTIVHMVLLIGVLLGFAAWWGWIEFTSVLEILVYCGLILVVYVGVLLFVGAKDKKLADSLNEAIRKNKNQ